MKLLLIQGANMEYLGRRQPELYGTTTAKELDALLRRRARALGVSLDILYTNTEGEAVTAIYKAERAGIDGILVQLPLPKHISEARVIAAIDPAKDVDGFHLYNVGGLVVGDTVFPPCTPYGVVKLLDSEGISVEGKNVVVVGASNIVGKPMALMLMQREATVAICHAKTRDLAQYTILADIVVVAAGSPNLIVPQMIRTGAAVIDVGINRLHDGKLAGDVAFDEVKEIAGWITPVPGGVGPMTVAMLLANTYRARLGRDASGETLAEDRLPAATAAP